MIRRFIADEFEGDRASLVGGNAHHLAKVLRAQVGQQFDIATGDVVRRGTVTAVTQDQVEFSLGETLASVEQRKLVLLLAVFKFDRFEWAVEKATELGVSTILPVIARRTDAHLAQAAEKRAERWRRIAHEASQQSRRVAVPTIEDPVKLAAKLKQITAEAEASKVLLAENEEHLTLAEALQQESEGKSATYLAIGPEGGWTDVEFQAFADAGWRSASLGETILRAETAAIAALAIAQSVISKKSL